ncbi:MAG: hypothetical protein ACKPKO_34625, partial [Candidatus Fonsibacter sp.]
ISAGTTLSAGGTISTSGNITASAGTITGKTLAITGTSGRPQIPTAQGCYIGSTSVGYTAIELVSGVGTTYQTYIDFTEPNVDFRGRIIYTNATNDCQFFVNSNATARMALNDTSLTVACNIFGNTVSCTGAIAGTTMSAQGVYAGVATTYGVIEMVGTDGTYIDFTAPNVDYKGRICYAIASNTFSWRVGGVITTVMQLSSANLQVN